VLAVIPRDRSHPPSRAGEQITEFSELDYALEWCEDRLLASAREEHAPHAWDRTVTELDVLLGLGGDVPELLEYLERVDIAPGEHLIRQGDDADALYLLETGQVSVYLETAPGERLRLREMGAGTVTGELGTYLGGQRNASVVADVPSVAWRLDLESLTAMETTSPHLATRFHRAMAGLLSGRLVATNRTIRAILD
jgi:SulP family sulfate permease